MIGIHHQVLAIIDTKNSKATLRQRHKTSAIMNFSHRVHRQAITSIRRQKWARSINGVHQTATGMNGAIHQGLATDMITRNRK